MVHFGFTKKDGVEENKTKQTLLFCCPLSNTILGSLLITYVAPTLQIKGAPETDVDT